MIIDLVKKSIAPLLIIGLVNFVIAWLYHIDSNLVHMETYNGIDIWVFTFDSYLTQVSNAIDTKWIQFEKALPTRTWDNGPWGAGNNLALLVDWMYMPINLMLTVVRFIAWLGVILLSIIGWNTEINQSTGAYNSSFIQFLVWIRENLIIPYI